MAAVNLVPLAVGSRVSMAISDRGVADSGGEFGKEGGLGHESAK